MAITPKKRLTREETKQQTRKNLLEAAVAVFAEKGFHGASIDDIASAAGYTKGAVYAHFASKDDLYLALLEDTIRKESPEWTRMIEEGRPVALYRQAVEKEILEAMGQQQNWALLSLEFFMYAMRNPHVKEKLIQKYQQGLEACREVLQKRYATAAAAPPLPLDELARALLVLDNGCSLLGMLSDPEAFSSLYVTLVGRLLDGEPGARKECI